MTRIAHLDPIGGLAGDMVLAALLDAGAPVAALEETVAALGLDVRIDIGRVQRSGIAATQVHVVTTARSSGRPAGELRAILTDASLPDEVGAGALRGVRSPGCRGSVDPRGLGARRRAA